MGAWFVCAATTGGGAAGMVVVCAVAGTGVNAIASDCNAVWSSHSDDTPTGKSMI